MCVRAGSLGWCCCGKLLLALVIRSSEDCCRYLGRIVQICVCGCEGDMSAFYEVVYREETFSYLWCVYG